MLVDMMTRCVSHTVLLYARVDQQTEVRTAVSYRRPLACPGCGSWLDAVGFVVGLHFPASLIVDSSVHEGMIAIARELLRAY